jgi:hypothetical protein
MQKLFDNLLDVGRRIRTVAQYFAGHSEESPVDFRVPAQSPLWGVWWAILLVLTFIFCGQSSKFIYIDF